ncbi:MAG: hypothetical protein IKP46_05385 [Bacteroidales bacterium]|nr:hypothetical protein [Bacteroidales bacterium]
MKRIPGKILSALTIVLTISFFITVFSASKAGRHTTSCNSLIISILDSADRNFISKNDVTIFMAEYGDYLGQRIDDVNLPRIEKILRSRSAIRSCEAYVTDDGVLHVDVTQRVPVVRFQKGDAGFYADRNGFIFPLQNKFTSMVPIVDGSLPIDLRGGVGGGLETEKEKQWVRQIIGMVTYMEKSRIWNDNISQMTVSDDGNLVLVPREGKERFIFGSPTSAKEKFGRIAEYYEAVAPLQKNYTSVDVRYSGRIICK